MKILLTGANGYIGKRLIPSLLSADFQVVCCVRDAKRFPNEGIFAHKNLSLFEIDFLHELPINIGISDFDCAFYLIHSMSSNTSNFSELEEKSAINFLKFSKVIGVKHIVYLSGIVNDNFLSEHLASRKNVEEILLKSEIPVTVLRAGIIVGSGSASFEIIRDLVEKLPFMIAPRWLNTKTHPIAIRSVLYYLMGVIGNKKVFNKSFDISGPEVLTYKELLLQFAEVRGLKRWIIPVPFLSPKISSYWLYFVTSTSYNLAVNLVDSMKVEVVAKNKDIERLIPVQPITYKEAVAMAFQKIEQNNVASSWKDALISSATDNSLLENINVPVKGCYMDRRVKEISTYNSQVVLENIWHIGGKRGWYYGNWMWALRGYFDKLVGGVGLRRGRTNPDAINTGDTLDFWRVLVADKTNKRLLLYAEMKLPGEAWLEFKIFENKDKTFLRQTATFRPKGLLGRLYWLSVLPFHFFVFEGMANNLINYKSS